MKSFNRDFHRKSFKNPLFPAAGKKRKLNYKIVLSGALIFFALIAVLYSSNWLKINTINIFGNESVNTIEIMSVINNQTSLRRFWLFKEDNLLFFDKSAAGKKLIDEYGFDSVKINKQFFHTLNVTVKEKFYSVIFITGGNRYYLDYNGRVIKKMNDNGVVTGQGQGNTQVIRSEIAGETRPILNDLSNTPIAIGQDALSREFIDFITDLNNELKNNSLFSISQFEINDLSIKYVTLVTAQGWKVMFSPDGSVKTQVALLNQVLTQRIKDLKKLKYVDLRYDGKVFYE